MIFNVFVLKSNNGRNSIGHILHEQSADVNNKQNPVLLFARPDAPPRIDEQVRRFYIAVHNLALMEMTLGENDASRIKLDATESCGGIMRAAWRVALRL